MGRDIYVDEMDVVFGACFYFQGLKFEVVVCICVESCLCCCFIVGDTGMNVGDESTSSTVSSILS